MVKNLPVSVGDTRHGFDPWVGKIPWRRAWQSTPVFLAGESHGQRSLMVTVYREAKSRTQLKELSTHTWRLDLECFGLEEVGKSDFAVEN